MKELKHDIFDDAYQQDVGADDQASEEEVKDYAQPGPILD